jgi:asparagine synthase (glutamine-hydrolysing)
LRSALASVAARLGRPLPEAILRHGSAHALQHLRAHMTRVWTQEEKAAFWRGGPAQSTDELIEGWYARCASRDPIDQLQQVYVGSWLIEDLLMKADKMSMAASLELRCPFLDHKLVAWCARLPRVWKVGSRDTGYASKRILREYARKRLPAEIVERPKRGFPVPAYKWLEQGLGDWARDRINSGRLARWIDPAAMQGVIDSAQRGSLPAQHKVWNFVVLDHWLEAWAA